MNLWQATFSRLATRTELSGELLILLRHYSGSIISFAYLISMKLSATSASCVPNLWHAIPVGVETETETGNEFGSVCRCAGCGGVGVCMRASV